MTPALFVASLQDSYKGTLIYFVVLFLYALMIMGVFPSMQGTFSDPMAEGNGIILVDIGTDDDGHKMFNLSWDTRIGAGDHVAVGASNPLTYSLFKEFMEKNDTGTVTITKELFEEAVENTSAMEEYGVRILYHGTGRWKEFSRTGNSSYFFVIFLKGGGNMTPVNISDVVSSTELVIKTSIDEYMEDNPFMESILGDSNVDFTSVRGFVAIEFFSIWPLFLVIYVGIKGGGVVSRHVEDLSMDILLATGYSRNRFLTEKMALLGVNLAAVILGGFLGLVVGVAMIGEAVPLTTFFLSFAAYVPMALAFIGIGVLVSVLMNEGSRCTWSLMGIIMGMYVIQIIANLGDGLWADVLGYLSLFTYIEPVELIMNHSMDPVHIIVPSLVGIVTLSAAYVLFNRKEIHT